MDEPIARLLRACGLQSFVYLNYPPLRIVPPSTPDPVAEPNNIDAISDREPEASATSPAQPMALPEWLQQPAEPQQPVPAMAAEANEAPALVVPRPAQRLPAQPAPTLAESPPAATPVVPHAAPSALPPAPHPARRFALLDEVSAEIALPRPPGRHEPARSDAVPKSPLAPRPPSTPPRLRLRRRIRPAGES